MSGRAPSSFSGLLSTLVSSWSPSRSRSTPTSNSAPVETQDIPSSMTSSSSQHMYGVELDLVGEEITQPLSPRPMQHQQQQQQRPIASTGFYGKGKGKARAMDNEDSTAGTSKQPIETPSASSSSRPFRASTTKSRSQPSAATSSSRELVLLPVRVYRCPTIDQPLYTVNKHKKTIHIHATDADSCYWPAKHTTRKRDPTDAKQLGIATWHEPVQHSTKQFETWKQKCGQGLASLLQLEGDPKSWVLADWPDGYKMFVHHQYDKPAAFFYYIVGSTFHGKRRFKTSKEFVKHLAWLCVFGNDLNAQCSCKFCVKDFQTNSLPRDAIVQRSIQVPSEHLRLARPVKRARTDAGPSPSSRRLKPHSSFASSVASTAPTLPPSTNTSRRSSPLLGASAVEVLIPSAASSRPVTPTTQPVSQARVITTTATTTSIRTSAVGIVQPASLHTPAATTIAPSAAPSPRRAVFSGQQFPPNSRTGRIDAFSEMLASMKSNISSTPQTMQQQQQQQQQQQLFPVPNREQASLNIAAYLSATSNSEQLKQSRGKVGRPRKTAFSDGAADSADTGDAASVQMASDTSNLGKRKRPRVDYYIPTIEEFSVIDAKAAELAAAAAAAENGRPARSTRNNKSMKESPPPPIRPPSGPMYNGPFIQKKRHDDLKVHSAPYREHEVVWYKLPDPPTDSTNPDLCIKYWPCEIILKALQVEVHHVEEIELENDLGEIINVSQPVNIQYYKYTVELFGVGKGQTVICKVDELLPWAAYGTPASLNNRRCEGMLRKQETPLEHIDDSADFADILTTWTWARHWALAIRSHFAPFGFYLDRDTIKRMRKRKKLFYANGKGPSVIVNGKRRKTRSNAQILARESEMDREREAITSGPQYYQGIWFGCEKFWVGELVRLAGTYTRSDSAKDVTAHLQLYRGNKSGEDKTQIVALDGLAFEDESEDKPAFFQVTHIYREPGGNGQGTLAFDGIFYQIVREDLWLAEKKPPSLLDGLSGTFDLSDASSDQEFLIDPLTGEKQLDLSIATMYRRRLLPPPPSGCTFRPLRSLDGSLDNDFVSTIHPSMIAGRYYPPGVLFSEEDDRATRKLVRSCSGKTFRPETQARPTHASVNRHLMVRASSRKANRDMQTFFDRKALKEQMQRNKDWKATIEIVAEEDVRDVKRSKGGSPTSGKDSQRSTQMHTPVSHQQKKRLRSPDDSRRGQEGPARKDQSKQTTVTDDDAAEGYESDAVLVASSKRD